MSMTAILTLTFIGSSVVFIIIGLSLKISTTNKLERCTRKTVGEVSGFDARVKSGYYPLVQYEVNGDVYKGRLIYQSFSQVKSPHYKGSEMTSDKFAQTLHIRRNSLFSTNPLRNVFPIGSPLDVYYNPENPQENYVQRKPKSLMPAIFLITGISTAFIGAMVIFLVQ